MPVEIWAGILGLAYLAALGLYFEMLDARRYSQVAARSGFGRRQRSHTVERRQLQLKQYPPGGAFSILCRGKLRPDHFHTEVYHEGNGA